MHAFFEGIDLSGLFDREGAFGGQYDMGALTDAMIRRAEAAMGYELPPSYKELLHFKNGGRLSDDLYEDSWLTAILGIGTEEDAEFGLEYVFEACKDADYPDIGIPFGTTHAELDDMYYMDFRAVKNGEPRIVRVDNEDENTIYFIADNLPEFIKMVLGKAPIEEEIID